MRDTAEERNTAEDVHTAAEAGRTARPDQPALVTGPSPGMARVVERNIRAMLARRRRDELRAGAQVRISDAITRFTGSMTFVALHLVLFGLWIVINAGWVPGVRRFDPSFVILAMFASVEAIFLSTFVLISQNRQAALADERAELDLQVSLLAEHEVTRLITLAPRWRKSWASTRPPTPNCRNSPATWPPRRSWT